MIPVIDVFAGPGGLNEGFSSVEIDGEPAFRIAASFEMDPTACRTLILRSALRKARKDGQFPEQYYALLGMGSSTDRSIWQFLESDTMTEAASLATEEVHQIELGPDTREDSDAKIEKALGGKQDWVLIGGPPCQAYSLVGRARRKHDEKFLEDKKHFLFREYLHIIERFKPAVFVMENVKGLLSSLHGEIRMFDLIREDLQLDGEYELRSFVVNKDPRALTPRDFVIRAEDFGIPQRRHRVILLGVRKDKKKRPRLVLTSRDSQVSVGETIGSLPYRTAAISPASEHTERLRQRLFEEATKLAKHRAGPWEPSQMPKELREWILDDKAKASLHQPRPHMASDLKRYAYAAHEASITRRSPRLADFPRALWPAHKNVGKKDTPFVDRFKVQLSDAPSTTVVSHIAKDGHYFIHPDPTQMRSLTVREAARLQTFPDNYFFMGPRTQQFHQVGNAVPPLLAKQLGEIVVSLFREELDR